MDIFKLIGRILFDNKEANDGIDETNDKASKLGESLKKGISTAGKWGTAIIGGASAIGAGMANLASSTRDYRNEMGKLDTAFTTNGHSSDAAKQTYQDLYSILGETDQAVEAANHLAKLTDNEKDLQSWTEICTGVFATFGASLPIEGLTEAANETAKVGQVTGPLADALNWAGVSEDEFNEKLKACSTEQERQQLITSTLTDLYSDASTQYKETNKDIIESNKAQASLTDTMAKMGGVVEPVITQFTNMLANILPSLIPVVSTVADQMLPVLMMLCETALPILVDLIEALIPAVLPLVEEILPLAAGILSELLPPLVSLAQSLLPIIVTLIQTLLPILKTAFDLLMPIFQLVLDLITPIVDLISIAITPLIETLVSLIQTILQPVIPILETICQVLGAVLTPIIQALTPLFEALSPVFDLVSSSLEPLMALFDTFVGELLNPMIPVIETLASIFTEVLGGAIESIMPWIEGVTGVFGDLIEFVTDVFTGDWESAWNGIVELFKGIINLIPTYAETVINLAIDLINGIISGINFVIEAVGIDPIREINKVSLPRLEKGGVLEQGQVGLLEGTGAEAVVPLDQNKAWISAVAADINEEFGGIGGNELKELKEEFKAFVENLPEMMVEAFSSMKFDVNNREFARMVKAVN